MSFPKETVAIFLMSPTSRIRGFISRLRADSLIRIFPPKTAPKTCRLIRVSSKVFKKAITRVYTKVSITVSKMHRSLSSKTPPKSMWVTLNKAAMSFLSFLSRINRITTCLFRIRFRIVWFRKSPIFRKSLKRSLLIWTYPKFRLLCRIIVRNRWVKSPRYLIFRNCKTWSGLLIWSKTKKFIFKRNRKMN